MSWYGSVRLPVMAFTNSLPSSKWGQAELQVFSFDYNELQSNDNEYSGQWQG